MVGVAADESEANCGLWVATAAAPGFADTGDGSGMKADIPPEACSKAGERTWGDCVFNGARAGFCAELELTDSGSSKFSIVSVAIESVSPGALALFALLGDGSLINEAGVAGDGFPVGRGAAAGAMLGVGPPFGWRYGEGFADRGFGRGGGGISDSVSGETELFSESIMPAVDGLEALLLDSGS